MRSEEFSLRIFLLIPIKIMKKIVYITALLACFNATVLAQDNDNDKKWPNGIRAGYQLSNFVKSGDKAASNINGFYAGYVRKVKLAHFFRLETGLEYSLAGSKINNENQVELNYLVLPAQFCLKIGPLYGLLGVNGNILLKEKLTINGEKADVDKDNRVKTLDIVTDGGLGFNILFLAIEARYYYGLVDLKQGWHNSYVQLGLKASF